MIERSLSYALLSNRTRLLTTSHTSILQDDNGLTAVSAIRLASVDVRASALRGLGLAAHKLLVCRASQSTLQRSRQEKAAETMSADDRENCHCDFAVGFRARRSQAEPMERMNQAGR